MGWHREPRARKTSEQFKLPFQVVTLFMRTKIIRWRAELSLSLSFSHGAVFPCFSIFRGFGHRGRIKRRARGWLALVSIGCFEVRTHLICRFCEWRVVFIYGFDAGFIEFGGFLCSE